MYFYIMAFQTACILVSGVCLYLAATEDGLRAESCCIPVLSVLLGIFLMETGYGLYLQETAMAGLQATEKICLLGKLMTGAGFFMTCMSLSDRNSRAVKTAVGLLALTAAVFVLVDSLYQLLFASREFLQNQYFYYIEAERTGLGEIFGFLLRCLPAAGILWFFGGRKNRGLPEKLFAATVIILWAFSIICRNLPFLRHYDADMPLGAAFAVCVVIYVAWKARKVYTET